MYTIGRLARQFNLSRSTLLYYDRLGLLAPSGRSDTNYRQYTRADRERLKKIVLYRKTGLNLKEIGQLLNNPEDAVAEVLERQLDRLNGEIAGLRAQQHLIMDLLVRRSKKVPLKVLNKQCWVDLLRSAGMDDAAMDRWHRRFEALSPESHQSFLESLGIDPEEVRAIRKLSRTGRP